MADEQSQTEAQLQYQAGLRLLLSRVAAICKTQLQNCVNLLFPATCFGCQSIVSQPATFCPQCWSAIRFIEPPYCPVLGTPFAYDCGPHFLCAEAIADPPAFGRLRSAVRHAGAAQHMVVALKFYDRTDLAPWMARWMYRAGRQLLEECDAIIALPLHKRRFRQRSFNQAAELGRALAKLSGKPFLPQAVQRVRNTKPQIGLGIKARQRNVDGAFRVDERHEILIHGRRIVLVDDVYTTGSTVKAATRALLRGGALSVDVLTFSRVLTDT